MVRCKELLSELTKSSKDLPRRRFNNPSHGNFPLKTWLWCILTFQEKRELVI